MANSEFNIQDYWDSYNLDDVSAEDEAAILAAIIEGFETTSLQPDSSPSSSKEQNSIVRTPDVETAILAAIIDEGFGKTSLQPDTGPSSGQEQKSIVQTPESSILHVDATIHATIDIPLGRPADRPETGAQEPAPPVPDEAYCSICMETKPLTEFFNTKFCTHLYCNECVGSYVTDKIQDGVGWINCPEPGCEAGFLDPDTCHLMLPQSLIDRWGDLVCEAMIQVKFYCPYKDCSALLINDQEDGDGEEIIVQSECPHCYRLFCAQCRSPWHEGLKCEEVQKLGEGDRGMEDLMLKKVAESSQWQRCPECQFFVERDEGCNHIICRCKYEFCYRCGAKWKSSHYGCTGAK